jgi:hypothetical protein
MRVEELGLLQLARVKEPRLLVLKSPAYWY